MEKEDKKQSYCVKTFAEFLARLKNHEIATSTKYVIVKVAKNFNADRVFPTVNQRIYWEDDIPYYHFGSKVYHCHQGKDRNLKFKKKYAEERDKKALEDQSCKRYKRKKMSKKLDCPASITVSRVIRIPEYQLSGSLSRHYEQEKVSKIIRRKVKDGTKVGEEGFIFSLPNVERHANHPVSESAAVAEPVDNQVQENISQSVPRRERNPVVMSRLLKTFLENELEEKDQLRRRVYPNIATIINECTSTLRSLQSILWYLGEDELKSLSSTLRDVYKATSSKVSLDEICVLPIEAEVNLADDNNLLKKLYYGKQALRLEREASARVGMTTDKIKESPTEKREKVIPKKKKPRKKKLPVEDKRPVEMTGKVQCAVCPKWELSETVPLEKKAKTICKMCC